MRAPIDLHHLLAEIEDVIRSMPTQQSFSDHHPDLQMWLGRSAAAIALWDQTQATLHFEGWVSDLQGYNALRFEKAHRQVAMMLHRAQNDLRMRTLGPVTVAIGQGGVFSYFDELRKIIEGAAQEVFFVDPYLDAEFVSRFLPYVKAGVSVRLLGGMYKTLLPAVAMYRQQEGLSIEVRSSPGLHDRYLFVDGHSCYQSGASFKDGAKKAGTTLTQIVDAFASIHAAYADLWTKGSTPAGTS